MESWLRESTRIFIDDLLKEDIGLGHMVDDGQTSTIALQTVEPLDPNLIQKIKLACDKINITNVPSGELKNLEKIYNYLNNLK
jgi:hypothetical protein